MVKKFTTSWPKWVFLGLMAGITQAADQTLQEPTCWAAKLIQQDLAELQQKLAASHYDLYAHVSQADQDNHLKALQNSVDGCMTTQQAELLMQRFASFGRVAHARVELPTHTFVQHLKEGGLMFPLDIKSDGQTIWVTANYSAQQSIGTGDQITAINGLPTEQLLRQLRHYLSADTDLMFGGFLEFYLPMLLWFELGDQTQFAVQFKTDNGTTQLNLAAISQSQMQSRAAQLPKPLELDWQRIAEVKADAIGYLRPGPFFDTTTDTENVWDNGAFKGFIDGAFETFQQHSVKAVLIDLRNNPGGDNSFSDLMIQWFADQPFQFAARFHVKVSDAFRGSNEARLALEGDQVNQAGASYRFKQAYQNLPNGSFFDFPLTPVQPRSDRLAVPVYVLVNRHSYSNTVTVAAMLQDGGFATVMGEETTDLATTYGAMEQFNLSHTGIQVGFPKAFIVRPSGDETIRGVVPDVLIKTPLFEDQSDPVLTTALEHVKNQLHAE